MVGDVVDQVCMGITSLQVPACAATCNSCADILNKQGAAAAPDLKFGVFLCKEADVDEVGPAAAADFD
jgi:hypothetical protein